MTSLALGGLLYAVTGSRKAAIAPLVSGFLIDFDHLFDFALTRFRKIESIMVLPLHGWEYTALWFVIDRRAGAKGGLLAGYVVHLLIDQIWNEKRSPWAYLVSYRASRGFRADQLGSVDATVRHRWRHSSVMGLRRWF